MTQAVKVRKSKTVRKNSIDQEIMKLRRTIGGLLGTTHNGARDLYGVFGYPRVVKLDDLQFMYDRNDIATRIVNCFPQATWRDAPVVRDEVGGGTVEGKADFSKFSYAVDKFFERHKVMHYMERADRVASIGHYGILVLGFADGKQLSEPLSKGKKKLIYLQPYGERSARIQKWVTDRNNARYGMPEMYQVNQDDLIETDGEKSTNKGSFLVHHSRVIHISEFLDEDDTIGKPRLLPVFNRLLDLEKVVGGAAETFWLTANRGVAFLADKEANLADEDIAEMHKQADELANSLRRHIVGRGMTAQVLGSESPDPGPNADKILELISGSTGIPKRILIGSERGELGGDNDENNWAMRIDERRRNWASPQVLRQFINLMIITGNIPKPVGQWWVEWPENDLGPSQKADVSLKKVQTLATYANSPNASLIVPVSEFRQKFLDMEPTAEDDGFEEELPLPEEEDISGDAPPEEDQGEEEPGVNFNYDPNQPRDDEGQWGDGAGSIGIDVDNMTDRQAIKAIKETHGKEFADSFGGKSASAAQAAAIDSYTSSDYLEINQSLRSGEYPSGKARKTVDAMDSMLAEASLSKDMVAHRTVSADLYAQFEANVGGEFYDSAYTSMTAQKGEGLTSTKGAQSMKILMPKGAKALPVGHLSGNQFEQEIIAGRGSRFSISKDKDGIVLTWKGIG